MAVLKLNVIKAMRTMRTINLSNRFPMVIIIIGVVFMNVLLGLNNKENKGVSLSFFGIYANANAETSCGAGDSDPFRQVKSGSQCTCNGQIIFSQSCEGSGNGCSPIKCGG